MTPVQQPLGLINLSCVMSNFIFLSKSVVCAERQIQKPFIQLNNSIQVQCTIVHNVLYHI
jgi:hypothetical protein